MANIPPAVFDPQRIELLGSYDILDTAPELGFDDVVMLARQICHTPIALVSLVDIDRQWFKAAAGLSICETPIEQSVCAHSLELGRTLNIPDLTQDSRTRHNTLVTGEPFIRFYAGAPLIASNGMAIGTVCVIDTVARPGGLDIDQIAALEALARQVMVQLEQRRLLAAYDARQKEIDAETLVRRAAETARQDSEDQYRSLFNSLDAGFCVIEMAFDNSGKPTDYKFVEVNDAFAGQTGLVDAAGKWMRELAPEHEQHWFDIYGKIALTGESARFENFAEQLGDRWFDVHAFRIGRPGAQQVAILFTDITVRKAAERQQRLLNDELGHRMKNTMALVQAIASQTLREVSDRDAVRAFRQRINTLSHAHDILLQQTWSSANLRDVIKGVLGANLDMNRVTLSGPELRLDPKAALSFSLLLHELATNAVKYGSLSVSTGRIELVWSKDVQTLTVSWVERDGPPVMEPTRSGLGTRLIDMGLVGTMGAVKTYSRSGFSVQFRAPLELIEYIEG